MYVLQAINGITSAAPKMLSPELINTIHLMGRRQAWLRDE